MTLRNRILEIYEPSVFRFVIRGYNHRVGNGIYLGTSLMLILLA